MVVLLVPFWIASLGVEPPTFRQSSTRGYTGGGKRRNVRHKAVGHTSLAQAAAATFGNRQRKETSVTEETEAGMPPLADFACSALIMALDSGPCSFLAGPAGLVVSSQQEEF